MSRMFNALSMQFKKQVSDGAGAVAFDGVKCYTPKATFYGECLQNGTPTPESPVPVLCNNAKWTTPVWNQPVVNGRPDSSYGITVEGGTIFVENGELEYVAQSTSGRNCIYVSVNKMKLNHIYYLTASALGKYRDTFYIRVAGSSYMGIPVKDMDLNEQNYTKMATIFTSIMEEPYASIYIGYLSGGIMEMGETYRVKNVMLVDLTALFGAGNEPSTVEEFEAWAKANGHDLDTYQPYDKGTPIGGAVDLSLLPDGGLYGIGDVHDEWDVVSGDGIRRFGKVDLGTLNWRYRSDYSDNRFNGFYTDGPRDGVGVVDSQSSIANQVCQIYSIQHSSVIFRDADMALIYNNGFDAPYNIRVHNSNYTSASDFKAAMSGVMLYYELATPVPFHATPQPLIQANGLNTLQQLSGDIADTDVSVEYVKHS